MKNRGDGIEVARWRKNDGLDVVLSLEAYHGHRLLHIREHYRKRNGKTGPTKRGVCVHVEHLADLAAGLVNAAARLTDLARKAEED